MKILIYTQLFTPEHGAGAIRLHNTANQLITAGHSVQVVAPTPNYPLGKTYPGYKTWQLYKKEVRPNGIIIHRFPTYPATGKSFKRLLNFIVFNVSSLLALFKVKEKPDLIFMNSGPLTLGANALLFKFLWRSQFCLFVADLWPKAVDEVNSPMKKIIISILLRFEKLMYKKANYVLCATDELKKNIDTKVSNKESHVSPNGVDTDFFNPEVLDTTLNEEVKAKINAGHRKVALYQGNHGYAHGIHHFINAYAKVDKSVRDKFKICFVGGGSAKKELQKLTLDHGFTTDEIEFYEPVKQDRLKAFISVCDLGLVTLEDSSFARDSRPAKIYPLLSMGKPLYFIGEGEGLEILGLSKSNYMLALPANESDIIEKTNNLESFLSNCTDAKSQSGRQFCIDNMDWKVIVRSWLKLVKI